MDKQQSVTSRRGDIPAHFVPISSFGCHDGKSGKKQTPEYTAVYAAWCEGKIGGFKFMSTPRDRNGRIFVDPADASQVIRSASRDAAPSLLFGRRSQGTPAATNLQYESVCESLADIAQSLAAVERLLERLATASESIVTQPKASQHDLLHTINGNPAPWNET
jgi:hypothetical protein